MPLFRQSSAAVVLVTLTLSVQSAGMATLIHWGRAHVKRGLHKLGPLRSAALVVQITHMMIVLHISQILVWAGFFRWTCFPSWESAFYFSTTTYSTVGYGDLVLPSSWRILGPIEAITGVLMCGLSAGFLFAIVTRLVGDEPQMVPAPTKRPAVLSIAEPF